MNLESHWIELSLFFETLNLTLLVSYNVHLKTPFNTYGESAFILVQSLVVLIQYGVYTKENDKGL